MPNHAVVFSSSDTVTVVWRNAEDLKKASTELRVEAALGVGPPGHRRPSAIGLTVVKLTRYGVASQTRVGKTTTKRYICNRTGASYASRAACEKSCRAKSRPRPPSGPVPDFGSDLIGGNASCDKEKVTVRLKYRVVRNYFVSHDVYRLWWVVSLRNMPAAARQVRAWNEKIDAHERRHVEEIEEAAKAMLPEERIYDATGEGESEYEAEDAAEKVILNKIAKDNGDIVSAFKARMERDAGKFHTLESSLPLPLKFVR